MKTKYSVFAFDYNYNTMPGMTLVPVTANLATLEEAQTELVRLVELGRRDRNQDFVILPVYFFY